MDGQNYNQLASPMLDHGVLEIERLSHDYDHPDGVRSGCDTGYVSKRKFGKVKTTLLRQEFATKVDRLVDPVRLRHRLN